MNCFNVNCQGLPLWKFKGLDGNNCSMELKKDMQDQLHIHSFYVEFHALN